MEREFLKPLPAVRSHLSRAVFTQAEGFRGIQPGKYGSLSLKRLFQNLIWAIFNFELFLNTYQGCS